MHWWNIEYQDKQRAAEIQLYMCISVIQLYIRDSFPSFSHPVYPGETSPTQSSVPSWERVLFLLVYAEVESIIDGFKEELKARLLRMPSGFEESKETIRWAAKWLILVIWFSRSCKWRHQNILCLPTSTHMRCGSNTNRLWTKVTVGSPDPDAPLS